MVKATKDRFTGFELKLRSHKLLRPKMEIHIIASINIKSSIRGQYGYMNHFSQPLLGPRKALELLKDKLLTTSL